MTRRQADLVIALLAACILAQVIIGAALLRGQELTRNEIGQALAEAATTRKIAEAAQNGAADTPEMQKRAELRAAEAERAWAEMAAVDARRAEQAAQIEAIRADMERAIGEAAALSEPIRPVIKVKPLDIESIYDPVKIDRVPTIQMIPLAK